jgi:hypothetical protein
MDSYFSGLENLSRDGLNGPLSPGDDSAASKRATALSTKLASVLSTPYADSEIREALRLFDLRQVPSDDWSRQNLKGLAEKEVIECDARIVDDFGHVAEVSTTSTIRVRLLTMVTATEARGCSSRKAQRHMQPDEGSYTGSQTRIYTCAG